MSIFKSKKTRRDYAVIIGCGRLGAALASSLSENGVTVSVIDVSKDSFRKLSPSFGGMTIVGSAINIDVLTKAQINSKTTVVCVTSNDNINIMSAQMVRELFSAGQVIARLNDPEKACICADQDIETICPAALSAKEITGLFSDDRTEEAAQ